jgi:predicted nucleotidyltransferase
MAQQDAISLLKKSVLLLNSEGIRVSKAYLFGSYLTGKANEQSDIDVMLVCDGYKDNNDLIIGKAWHLARRVSTKIEPFFVDSEKFYSDNTSPLVSNVRSTGIEIA